MVSADHQNKPDIGVGIARRWYENENVDAIFDLPNSAIALAVAAMSEQKNKVFVGSGAGTALLTGEKCTPNTVHWTYDTYAYGRGLGKAVVAQGGKKWFFLTADYAFGHDLEKQAMEAVKASGGEVVGAVRHPLGTADYASYLLQAQASGADVIGIANAGDDTITSMKQAAEFGLTKKQKLVGLILGMNGLPALTLKAAQGAQIMNPVLLGSERRHARFAKRFAERHPQKNYPNDMQAGVYASVIHYLKAVDKVGGAADGKAVVAAMKAIPTDDPLFGKGYIRADGRKIHPLYLLEVKKPDKSKSKWDLLEGGRHDPRRGGVPAGKGWRLPAVEIACAAYERHVAIGGFRHAKRRNAPAGPRAASFSKPTSASSGALTGPWCCAPRRLSRRGSIGARLSPSVGAGAAATDVSRRA